MSDYLFKTWGVDKESQSVRNIDEAFTASSDEAAIEHVQNTLAPQANSALITCESAELRRADGTAVGVLDMRRLTWQLGNVPRDNRPVYDGYSRAELKPALDLIKNPEHWKYPFDAIVPTDADRDLIAAAAAFFCGSSVEFEETSAGLRVTGPGYFECVGA